MRGFIWARYTIAHLHKTKQNKTKQNQHISTSVKRAKWVMFYFVYHCKYFLLINIKKL
ncbi:hypothetical protein Hanom_Chr15g01339201 [Helianthus anomalus]